MSKVLRVASTFSGGFGSVIFALKYMNIPFSEVFACEIEKAQRWAYINNHGIPTDGIYTNILTLNATKYIGLLDLLWHSPSCKQYSPAGSRNGLNHEDGQLMDESIRVTAESQPKMFVIENSSEVLSVNGGRDWKLILKALKKLKGYTISYGVMNEKDYGTPQNRKRLLIVGIRALSPAMNFPEKVQLNKCLADLLEEKVPKKYYLSMKMMRGFKAHKDRHDKKGNNFGMKLTDKNGVCGTISTKCGNRQTDPFISDLVQVGNVDTKGHNSLWGRVYSPEGIASNQNANGGGVGAKTGLYYIKSNNKKGYEVAIKGDSVNIAYPTSNTRRGRVGKQVSQTLTTQPSICVVENKFTNSRIITFFELTPDAKFINNEIRRLVPREQARVMGDFEDRFQFGDFSDTKLSLFIGNAVGLGTAKALLTSVFKFSHTVQFGQPIVQAYESIKPKIELDLFGNPI